jgi:hypothetical protein
MNFNDIEIPVLGEDAVVARGLLSLDDLESIDVPFNEGLFNRSSRCGKDRRREFDLQSVRLADRERRGGRDRRLQSYY